MVSLTLNPSPPFQLAAVIRRNDGQCHLQRNEEQGYYEYLEDSELVRMHIHNS